MLYLFNFSSERIEMNGVKYLAGSPDAVCIFEKCEILWMHFQ